MTVSNLISRDDYINTSFEYYNSNKWRNVGIVIAFVIGLAAIYIFLAEKIQSKKSKGEVLVFRRGHEPAMLTKKTDDDIERGSNETVVAEKHPSSEKADVGNMIQKQTAIFSWKDVTYDVKIKKETRRILDHVDGWVKPGTLTALMGVCAY